MCDNRHSWIQQWRSLLQEWIRPTLEDTTPAIDSELSTFCVKLNFNIFSFHTFANKEGLAEEMYIPVSGDLPKKSDVSSRDVQGFGWNDIVRWQLADFGASAVLNWRQTAGTWLGMLRIDRLLQA